MTPQWGVIAIAIIYSLKQILWQCNLYNSTVESEILWSAGGVT